jgi:hypothetical protein
MWVTLRGDGLLMYMNGLDGDRGVGSRLGFACKKMALEFALINSQILFNIMQ